MKIPHFWQPFVFFITQFFSYALIIVNGRAYNQANYVVTFSSDLVFASYGFFVIKAIGNSSNKLAWVGYTIGGATGSLFGIWISKVLLGA